MSNEIDGSTIFDQLLKDQVIYAVDKDFNVVYVSEGAINIFRELNHTTKNPIGKKCYELFRKRNTKCEDCNAASLLRSEIDDSCILPDRVCKRYDVDGEMYIIHHLFDSKLLAWNKEYSERLVNAAREAIGVTDLEGKIININPAFEREMGYKADDVRGYHNSIFYVDADEARRVTETIKKNNKLEDCIIEVLTKDGRTRKIELTAWVSGSGGNKVIVRVSKFLEKTEVLKSIIRITENILAYETTNLGLIVEETAKLLNSKYCAIYLISDDSKRLVLEAAHDSEYMKKAKNSTYALNWNAETDSDFDGITSMVAIRRHAFEADNWEDITTHPAHKGKFSEMFLESSSGKNGFAMYEIPLILEDEVKGVFRIEYKNDGTKYSVVDKEIFELMGKYVMIFLKEERQLRKNVLTDIAHMTRSPIAEAITNLSLLSDRASLGGLSQSEFSEAMRLVKNAIMQASITIENLIIWSTDSSDTGRALVEPIRVGEIISKITRSFEAFTTNAMFKVDVNDIDSIPLSVREQIKLDIILKSVIHNSIKYSRPNTHYANITISGKVSGDNYIIKVRDNGIGMSKEDLKNVWNEFYKGDSSRYDRREHGSVRGLGMGLASVSKICAQMGWKRNLFSKVGKGTTFVLKIPMRGV